MKHLASYFFRGLLAVLPVGLTIYVLYLFLAWSESLALQVIRPFVGDFYIPGMGLIIAVAGIALLGFLISQRGMARIIEWLELPFTNLPVVKSIYSSLKSFADYFSPDHNDSPQQVVVVRMPGEGLEVVGMVTRQGTSGLPGGFLQGDRVAVYLPMGYMIGGYTIFVPRGWVTPLDMTVEEAMRNSLIAWMAKGQDAAADAGTTATGPESRPR